jgi:hypothetical protein
MHTTPCLNFFETFHTHGTASTCHLNDPRPLTILSAGQAIFPQYKYPQAKRRYAEVAAHLGLSGANDDESVMKLIEGIEKLKRSVGIPGSLAEIMGAEKKDVYMARIDDIANQAFDDQCTGANPRYPLIKDLSQVRLLAGHTCPVHLSSADFTLLIWILPRSPSPTSLFSFVFSLKFCCSTCRSLSMPGTAPPRSSGDRPEAARARRTARRTLGRAFCASACNKFCPIPHLFD